MLPQTQSFHLDQLKIDAGAQKNIIQPKVGT